MAEVKRLVVLISPKEHTAIKYKALASGLSISNLIRQSIGLKSQKQGVRTK